MVFIIVLFSGFYFRYESGVKTQVLAPLSHDAGQYYQYAFNLRHHHVYSKDIGSDKGQVLPDALRPPGYPIFLSFFVHGIPDAQNISNIVLAQVLVSVGTVVFSFFLFNHFLTFFWSIAAAMLTAVSPHLIVANSYVLTESLFCFLLVIFCLQGSVFISKPKISKAVAMGGICAGLALVRPSANFLLLVILIVFVMIWKKRQGLIFFAGALVGFALFFSPWAVRNLITLHKVSDSTLMTGFLHHGMYPDFQYQGRPETFGFPYRFDPRSNEIEKNLSSVFREIINRFKEDPLKYLKWYFLGKPSFFWSWNLVQGHDIYVYRVASSPFFDNPVFKWIWCVMRSLHNALVVLCAMGCVLVWLPNSFLRITAQSLYTGRFISLVLSYFTLLHMIGAPFPRYSVPLRPLLYGMAFFVPTAFRPRFAFSRKDTSFPNLKNSGCHS
jgi:hypothetical protein